MFGGGYWFKNLLFLPDEVFAVYTPTRLLALFDTILTSPCILHTEYHPRSNHHQQGWASSLSLVLAFSVPHPCNSA